MALFGLFSKKKKESLDKGLEKTKESVFKKLSRAIVGKSKVDEEVLDNLEEVLISSDVGVDTTLRVIRRIEERVQRDKYVGVNELNRILKEEIVALLKENTAAGDPGSFTLPENGGPYVIMVVGVNGVGKTTTIGKLAHKFKEAGKKVVLGAADTFRAAAVDQLVVWAERVGVPIVKQGMGADPAAVAFEAMDMALRGGYDVVMTAHHEDDRIETFLMQWMRGSGLEGLAAFPKTRSLEASAFVHGRRTPGTVLLLRPWIGVSRAEIDRYVHNRRIAYVNDESNDDPRYLRNRVRHEIVPILEAVRPGFRQGAVRSINLVSEALDVLKSVAAGDLEACRSGAVEGGLSVVQLLRLIPSRQSWCLRAWLQSRGLSAPPKRKLDEALRQIREAGSETNFCLRVQGREIRRWGGDLVLCEAKGAASSRESVTTLRWTGEDMPIPGWDGTIRVVPCGPDEPGIALERLEAPSARLEVRSRRGSVKLKLWALRPAQPLKDLYAQAGIPAYARADLPVLWLDGEPVFAAGLGIDVRAMSIEGESARRVRFVFAPQKSLWDVQVLPNYADVPEDERRAREAKLKAAAKQFEKNARARRARAAS